MIVRNAVSFPPALHGGVIAMAQRASEWADASACADDLSGCNHVRNVRMERTPVNNVDCVRSYGDIGAMPTGTTGQQLVDLKTRSGLSLDAIAIAAGYKGRSGVQSFFNAAYELPLDGRVATKIADALDGKGTPPITRAEVMALTGIPETNATVLRYEGASMETWPRDLPVYGTTLGAPREFEGTAVEQTMLNTGQTIEYLRRPAVLNGIDAAYGLYVQGSSMTPRFEDGETIYVTDCRKARPPRLGEYVVVYLRDLCNDDGESASAVLVKRLVRKNSDFIELEQFFPALAFRIRTDNVLRMDRVLPWSELLS